VALRPGFFRRNLKPTGSTTLADPRGITASFGDAGGPGPSSLPRSAAASETVLEAAIARLTRALPTADDAAIGDLVTERRAMCEELCALREHRRAPARGPPYWKSRVLRGRARCRRNVGRVAGREQTKGGGKDADGVTADVRAREPASCDAALSRARAPGGKGRDDGS
jgi:hypothetical protein